MAFGALAKPDVCTACRGRPSQKCLGSNCQNQNWTWQQNMIMITKIKAAQAQISTGMNLIWSFFFQLTPIS